MSEDEIEYPNLRDSQVCPLCDRAKPLGNLACWPCYLARIKPNGLTADIKAKLDKAEGL